MQGSTTDESLVKTKLRYSVRRASNASSDKPCEGVEQDKDGHWSLELDADGLFNFLCEHGRIIVTLYEDNTGAIIIYDDYIE